MHPLTNQTINEIYISCYILLSITIQSHSAKNGCFKQMKACLIVALIQSHSMWTSCTFWYRIQSSYRIFCRKINRDNHFLCSQSLNKNKLNNPLCYLSYEYIFLFIEIRYLIRTQSILTLIIQNNSNFFVSAFSKQQQGAWKVCYTSFSVIAKTYLYNHFVTDDQVKLNHMVMSISLL